MRRRVGFLFICSALIPIAVFASTAWACGALTTLTSNTRVAAPNQSITLTGRNFGAVPPNTAVQIRWDSRTGPKLGPDLVPTGGTVTTNVNVPATATPGDHVILATQYNATTGAPKSGSPARTTVRVQGAAVASAAAWGPSNPTGSGGPGPDLPFVGLLLSAALLATGVTLVARDRRQVTRPVLGV
ncbi:MAG: hypothetical protein M3433_04385 [Actinomycetota bacterium]|nr:hypothetical protein [Actinomycetota bacterium]